MMDIAIVALAVTLSVVYFALKIIKFIRRPAGTSGCGCSSTDCGNCPGLKKSTDNKSV